jgi:hypothetical protein
MADNQSASPSWCQAPICDPRPIFLSPRNFQLRVCYSVAPSLTRGRVRKLLLLLIFVSAVPLGSESRGTQGHILLSQFLRLPQPGGPGSPYLYPPGTGCPRYTPGHWVPFPSPLTTRKAAVEVFYLASTRKRLHIRLKRCLLMPSSGVRLVLQLVSMETP